GRAAVAGGAGAPGGPALWRFRRGAAAAGRRLGGPRGGVAGGLQGAGPPRLADRVEVHRRALALPRHLDRLQRWERKARGVGFLDEGYAASQVWKADWEQLGGDELAARAA